MFLYLLSTGISYIVNMSPTEPCFLSSKVDEYYSARIEPFYRHPLHGSTPGEDAVFLNGNDYLQLANHNQIRLAQIKALKSNFTGPQQSGVFLHDRQHPKKVFETRMAEFLGFEDVELCQSGFNANVGLLESIAGPGIPVYVDFYSHFSFIEGVISAQADLRMFRHNSPKSLEKGIMKHGPGIIAIDSVYSTSGDIAPLLEMSELARRYKCVFVVDESHSLGTHGIEGAGLVAEYKLQNLTHFLTCSLAKTFVTRAGIIAGSKRNLDYIRCTSRPAIFSSVIEPHEAVRCMKVLEVIRKAERRRERLHRNACAMRKGLTEAGYNITSKSQIIGLVSGNEARNIALMDALEKRGIFGSPFIPPATPRSGTMIRLSVHSELTAKTVRRIIKTCELVRNEVWNDKSLDEKPADDRLLSGVAG